MTVLANLARVTPYLRWIRTPLGSLGLAGLASALCGLFLHPQGFMVLLGVVAATTLGLVWPWLSVRGLSGSLTFDRARCREGETVQARLVVRNRMPWGAWGVSVRGEFPGRPDAGLEGDALASLAHVAGWRTTTADVAFVPSCRGVYPSSSPRLACGFPFGLWQATRPLVVSAPLIVWPRTFAVGPVPDARAGHAAAGLAPRDRAGHWGDPLGVRPYRRGDPLRRVHWGQTARHGELIVCEVQSNAVPRVQVVVDTHPAAHRGSGPDGPLEWALRVAASFVEGWTGQGAAVELVFDGGTVRAGGASSRTCLLDAFAGLTPAGKLELAGLLDLPCCRSFGGTRVIVTTVAGVQGVSADPSSRCESRFVILNVGPVGAGSPGAESPALLVVPWILIEGSAQVAGCLRRSGKGVRVGC